MKTRFLILIIALCVYGCVNTDMSEKAIEPESHFVIGKSESLHSEILQETRNVWVHMPVNAQEGKKYPVLYLLDGNGHFYSVAGMTKQLSSVGLVPEMIVVAILNTNRSRDLTPTKAYINRWTGDSLQYESGGSKDFLSFIEKELVPFIDNNYPTTPFKTYVGHSFGGLSVIDALVHKTDLFNQYVSIDPSLWWDDMTYLHYVDSVLTTKDLTNKGLYVGIANTMEEGMDISRVESDTAVASSHIRSILKFVKSQDKKENGLAFDWKYYDDDDHGTVPLITEYDAFRFLFSWYKFEGARNFWDTTKVLDESIALMNTHYEKVSSQMGYEVLPDEAMINRVGYYYVRMNMLDEAAMLFDMNIRNYPNVTNVYDSRGDCYLAAGDSLKALEMFEKALEVGDNDFSQEKIDMIKENLKE